MRLLLNTLSGTKGGRQDHRLPWPDRAAEKDTAAGRALTGASDFKRHDPHARPAAAANLLHACILLLLLISCKTASEAKSEAHADLDFQGQLSGIEAVVEHKTQAPSLILEFAPIKTRAGGRGAPVTAYPPSAAVRPQDLPDSNRATGKDVDSLPPHGDLLKATFVGGSTDESERLARIEAAARLKAEADAKAEAAKKSGPAGLFGGLMAILGAVWPMLLAGLAAWLLWPYRKALPVVGRFFP